MAGIGQLFGGRAGEASQNLVSGPNIMTVEQKRQLRARHPMLSLRQEFLSPEFEAIAAKNKSLTLGIRGQQHIDMQQIQVDFK
jgi:hypothetical protein